MTTKITQANTEFSTVTWQSVIVADGSTTTTAEAGKGYIIDTSSNTHTINLPASPSAGDLVAVIQSGTNTVTVGRNGNNILSSASDKTLTSAASMILVYSSSASIGWVLQNNDVPDSFVSATGGTVTTTGNFKIHTFTSSGCFTVQSTATNSDYNDVSYMVVAGGGAGGFLDGGGGGAGGFREGKSTTNTDTYTASPLDAGSGLTVTASTYPITVGAGGSYNPSGFGNNGANSVFSTITSTGGGGGGGHTTPREPGANGGSGGGGSHGPASPAGASGNAPPVSPPQGNNGGAGIQGGSGINAGGGGGGAGGSGYGSPTPDSSPTKSQGGAGVSSSISDSPTSYSGGGGGGLESNAPQTSSNTGGTGGGGAGSDSNATATTGTANTGGGGGGGGYLAPGGPGGQGAAGGSGIVIIRYKYQ